MEKLEIQKLLDTINKNEKRLFIHINSEGFTATVHNVSSVGTATLTGDIITIKSDDVHISIHVQNIEEIDYTDLAIFIYVE